MLYAILHTMADISIVEADSEDEAFQKLIDALMEDLDEDEHIEFLEDLGDDHSLGNKLNYLYPESMQEIREIVLRNDVGFLYVGDD